MKTNIHKKILVICFGLLTITTNAETYKIQINGNHYQNSIKVKPINNLPPEIQCNGVEVLSSDNQSCENTINDVSWIFTNGDTCNGMRQSNFNPNVYFARARFINGDTNLDIPVGYTWLTLLEYSTLFNDSAVANKNDTIFKYHSQCGIINKYPEINGTRQHGFYLNGNGHMAIHAGNYELTYSTSNESSNFAGYVLFKNQ
jgi:hypothetical protein